MNRRADPVREISQSRDRLVSDFKELIGDAEGLLRATANFSGENLSAARSRLEDQLDKVRDAVSTAEGYAMDQARRAAKSTDRYVHHNPWQAIGVAVAAGILVGFLARGR